MLWQYKEREGWRSKQGPGSEGPRKPGKESGASSEGNTGAVIQSDLHFRWATLAVA